MVNLRELDSSERYLYGSVANDLDRLHEAISPSAEAAARAIRMEEMAASICATQERMGSLVDHLDAGSALSDLSELIEHINAQQRAIEALRPSFDTHEPTERLSVPDFEIPPNPLHETNDRLASIEDRFDRMEAIAVKGAEIATGLQAAAAEFLVKFEQAASNNDRAAGRAIRLGVMAVLIALAMPLAQIIYTEFWRVPHDTASVQAVIIGMKEEIAALRDTQTLALDRLSGALSGADADAAETLRDIQQLLTEQRMPSPSEAIAPE